MTLTAAGRAWCRGRNEDTRALLGPWPVVWQAVACHRSQLPGYQRLKELPPEQHHALWGSQGFYRVFSTVNGGRAIEHDLFAGLR
jgi:hypothetical protein